jgi:hypothetical protein
MQEQWGELVLERVLEKSGLEKDESMKCSKPLQLLMETFSCDQFTRWQKMIVEL